MSNQLVLEQRTVQGKKLKVLRRTGQVPSVVYGNAKPVLGASAYNDTEKVLREVGHHSPVELVIEGKKQLAIVKNVTLDPVSRRIMNIEFQAIKAGEVVEATAPIRLVKFEESEAAKLHYVPQQTIEEIAVKAKPSDLPEELTIDGSKLATIEDKLTLTDLVLPAKVELADKDLDANMVIVTVYDPAAAKATEETDETEANGADETEVEKVADNPSEEVTE